jgi:hypothetical protein
MNHQITDPQIMINSAAISVILTCLFSKIMMMVTYCLQLLQATFNKQYLLGWFLNLLTHSYTLSYSCHHT